MPEIIFKNDYKDADGNIVYPKGAIRVIFPGSDLLKDILDSEAGETMDYLPIGFPGIKHLIKAGIDSYQKLKNINVLEIDGIGEKTAAEIKDLLTQNKK